MAKQLVTISIPEKLYKQLHKIAREKRTTVRLMTAGVIQQIAMEYWAEKRKRT